jgi:hypothetical protein
MKTQDTNLGKGDVSELPRADCSSATLMETKDQVFNDFFFYINFSCGKLLLDIIMSICL